MMSKVGRYLDSGMLTMKGNTGGVQKKLVLTRKGKLLTDGITAELFFEESQMPVG
jgi:hypothetical protein